MIKAKDLRLGNWFRHNNCMCKEEMQLIPEDFQKELVGDYFPQFDPIPLTVDILKKCGFKKTGRYAITYAIGEIELLQPEKDDPFTLAFYESKISTLHQLQNLYFALTGGELTVHL